jgi:Asp/Glu/hydantoin racemase
MSGKLGVLILDTRFPRLLGDPGNPATYEVPAILRRVEKATVDKIVSRSITDDVAHLFIKAAKELERENVTAITTSCGFLIYLQDKLARNVNIPVFTSTLLLLPLAWRITQKPVGILTANSDALTMEHLRKAGAENIDVRIKGLEDKPEFRRVILEDSPTMDIERMRRDIVEAAKELVDGNPDIGSIVCECTNLAPFREDIKKAAGKPVFDYLTLVTMAVSSTTF